LNDTPMDQQIAQAIRMGIAAAQKGDHESALKVFKAVYDNPAIKSAPPDGLSYYGLSLAIEEKHTGKGVQACREAINAQFFDERHYENLIRIHLHKGNRVLAEQALNEGLRNVPQGSRLAALGRELGLQPAKSKPKNDSPRRGLDLKSLPPAVIALAGVLFFALTFGITFLIAYRQVYGP
jgi:hypothetical protein